jgi:hypothetical protein
MVEGIKAEWRGTTEEEGGRGGLEEGWSELTREGRGDIGGEEGREEEGDREHRKIIEYVVEIFSCVCTDAQARLSSLAGAQFRFEPAEGLGVGLD